MLGILLRLGPLPLATLVVGVAAWYHFFFEGFSVAGTVLDAESGKPIQTARVWSGERETASLTDGSFVLDGFKPPEPISIDAPGYGAVTVRPWQPPEHLDATLAPQSLEIVVSDAETAAPIADAVVQVGSRAAVPKEGGTWRLAPVLPTDRLAVSAPGYIAREVPYEGQSPLKVSLAQSLAGRVVNADTGKGVARARLTTLDGTVMADAQGEFQLTSTSRKGPVTVLAPGYRRAVVDLGTQRSAEIRLEPIEVRAIYFTYAAIGDADFRQRMFELLDTTEANAVVIDVKGDRGYLSYESKVPLAEQIGANDRPTVPNVEAFLRPLRERGIYLIARQVVFKDDLLAHNGPRAGLDVAIKDRRTGKPWIDLEQLAWADAFQPAAWDYNIALAREAIELGFDEVQFDYIRFPTDPSPGASIEDTQYSQPFTEENRVEALKTFLGRAREVVNDAGGFLAIDTFGYTTWWEHDGGIGQDLRVLGDYVDYICPMVYPSTYSAGLPGLIPYPAVVRKPYEVIYESLKNVQPKLAGKRVVVRPWLQYFDDYGADEGYRYDAPQIEAQKKATADAQAVGWMMWDPTNLYRRGGFAPES